MTLLNREEINQLQIVMTSSGVMSAAEKGARESTYDSTVGEIYNPNGELVSENIYNLPPRGIAWVVSKEHFNLPKHITGITTLRTTWTKKGILTLTVGVVDPGYSGPLSTAVINFGQTPFPILKGDTFFRTAFFKHTPSNDHQGYTTTRDKYLQDDVIEKTRNFSETFLTINTLADELAQKIFSFPRWAFKFGLWALFLSALAIVWSMASPFIIDTYKNSSKIEQLEKRIESLENQQ